MSKDISVPIWKQVLRQNFIDISKLADFLLLNPEQRMDLLHRPRFVLNLPFRIAEKVPKGDINDPILKQFLPTNAEMSIDAGFLRDPVGDTNCLKSDKLLHKYFGRVLIVTTGACAMHCRYCFRQNFDYIVEKGFKEELKLIAEDRSINEVILSGGDPLSLDDRTLGDLLKQIELISHVKKVRFHTRFPIGIPERIDESFLSLLANSRLQFWFVIHVNHPREFDEEIFAALKAVQRLGIPVLSQSVLLRGVNDSFGVLKELFETMIDRGIIPYYLNQLDRVQGASHFEVPEEEGKKLMADLAAVLPGYAIPRYIREIPGMPGKTPIDLFRNLNP